MSWIYLFFQLCFVLVRDSVYYGVRENQNKGGFTFIETVKKSNIFNKYDNILFLVCMTFLTFFSLTVIGQWQSDGSVGYNKIELCIYIMCT